jgi:hypothetical protein
MAIELNLRSSVHHLVDEFITWSMNLYHTQPDMGWPRPGDMADNLNHREFCFHLVGKQQIQFLST